MIHDKKCKKCGSKEDIVYCFVRTDLNNSCICDRVYLCFPCWEQKEEVEKTGKLFL